MVVRIRLSRFGRRHQPFYNIVVCNGRTARDSKPIEVLGTYNPIPQKPTGLIAESIKTKTPYKQIELDSLRTKYWLGVGAQPSEPAFKLLSMIGLVEPKPGATPVKILPPRGPPPRESKDGVSARSQESKQETTKALA